MRYYDLAGQRFGKVVVLHRSAIKARNAYWLCQCDCGRTRAISTITLHRTPVPSCGCESTRLVSLKLTRHGHRRQQTSEYTAWISAKDRCYNPRKKSFADYAGRGIQVCERWRHDFGAFLADMGHKPSPEHSIDR